MRRKIYALLSAGLLLLNGCSNGAMLNSADAAHTEAEKSAVDRLIEESQGNLSADDAAENAAKPELDLTELSSTMVYAEVYNMMLRPEEYLGRTIRMEGQFSLYQGADRDYYACIIKDATACCAQGIEFVLKENFASPRSFPEVGDKITVSGTFDIYTENGGSFCQLVEAVLE